MISSKNNFKKFLLIFIKLKYYNLDNNKKNIDKNKRTGSDVFKMKKEIFENTKKQN